MNATQRKAKKNWEYMIHRSLTDAEFLAISKPKAAKKATVTVAEQTTIVVETKPAKHESHRCHYCGLPATSRGFFDEWVCSECGGH